MRPGYSLGARHASRGQHALLDGENAPPLYINRVGGARIHDERSYATSIWIEDDAHEDNPFRPWGGEDIKGVTPIEAYLEWRRPTARLGIGWTEVIHGELDSCSRGPRHHALPFK